ncbi:MAG: hypothetical protein C4306_03290 [Thermoleophilia bacterium]
MPRLPLLVRGVRAARPGGNGLRDAGRDERRRGHGRGGGRSGRPCRPSRSSLDRERDRGGDRPQPGAPPPGSRAGPALPLGRGASEDGRGLLGGDRVPQLARNRGVAQPLVVVDADVLGRRRTGDETYVENLLRALVPLAEGELRLAALTRRPELVPDGVRPVPVPARVQEARMAVSVPRALARLEPALVHFQHALPLGCRWPAVVTIHDLSFAREPWLMRPWDRLLFCLLVPRAVRRAAHVLAVSERTKGDLVELYGLPPDRVTVTPNGVDPLFTPCPRGGQGRYLLFVGSVERRKNPRAALEAAVQVGLPLVVVGPTRDRALARELARRGADVRGYVTKEELAELYRRAACLLFPSRYEGFGLPVVEAMACGTPVVAAPDPALREVAGEAAVLVEPERMAEGVRRALADRERLVAAGLERARRFTWEETARRTLAVYRRVLAGR